MEGKIDISFKLDGNEVNPPKNWLDIEIKAAFGDELQPQIENDEFTFVNENALFIRNWILEKSIFQGIPFTITYKTSEVERLLEYNCILDLTEMVIVSPVEISVKIKPDEGLDLFDKRVEGISFGYLAALDRGEKGFIDREHYTDVGIVIRKKFDGVEVAMASISIYLLSKEIAELAEKNGISTIKKIKALITTPTAKPAEIFELIGLTILLIAYNAFMLIVMLRMVKTIYDNLLPKFTKYKGITLRTALERGLDYFDMTLDCDIDEIDRIVYLPSKTDDKIRKNRKDEGIPNTNDFGYQFSEMLELVFRLFRSRMIKVSNVQGKQTLIIRADKSEDLRKLSTYVMPNPISGNKEPLQESFEYNTNEMIANFIMSFEYDPSDEWTMPNARDTPFDSKKKDEEKDRYERGVSYEVITDIANNVDRRLKLNKGLEQVRIPLALGTRRDKLSVFETTAKVLFFTFDLIIKLFGGKTIGESINEGRGRLLISHNSFSTAKLIYLDSSGTIPKNHRGYLSARALYNNYHNWRSFKTNPEYAQKLIFKNIKIPFGFSDFIKTQKFSNFTTKSGTEGRFRNLKWHMSKDFAVAEYEVYQQYVNPDLLIETFIEPPQ